MTQNSNCPSDFSAVVVTPPPDVSSSALDDLLDNAKELMAELAQFPAHRVIFARQIVNADSSTVAILMDLARRATEHNCKFVICDPPAVLDNYLDIYLPGDDRSQCIFYTDRDAACDCPVPWLPAFQPNKRGSIDIWKDGHWHASYVWTHEGMRKAGTDPS